MAQSLSHPTLPQELQERILGFLPQTEDLKSCALSASSLLWTAQSYLFYDISVYHPRDGTDERPTEEEDCAFVSAAFRRLAQVLLDSPHLIPHIRSVSITTYLEVVMLLANMGLTHLCNLQLHSDTSDAIDGPLVVPISRLIGLGSMRRVKICAAFSAQIFSLACSPFLTELAFDAAEQDSDVDRATHTSCAQRTKITHLTLRNSPAMADWLVDAGCPFDFSHLVEVSIIASMNDRVHWLLAHARKTINTLALTASDLMLERLDLAHFSALKHIYLSVPHICYIARLLPSISDLDRTNIIHTITLNLEDSFCDHHWTRSTEDKLVQFDTILASLPLPALVEVLVILPRLDGLGDYVSDAETTLKRAMPLLSTRPVLRVEVNTD